MVSCSVDVSVQSFQISAIGSHIQYPGPVEEDLILYEDEERAQNKGGEEVHVDVVSCAVKTSGKMFVG